MKRFQANICKRVASSVFGSISKRSFSFAGNQETVFITGANRGLGLEFTKQYCFLGTFNVIACARNPGSSSELTQLASRFRNLTIETLDVTNEDNINFIAEKYSNLPIDICLLNAGIGGEIDPNTEQGRRIGNLTKQDLVQTFVTNAVGPLLIAQALLSNVAGSRRKQIVCISSGMGSIQDNNGQGGKVPYRISKCAVNCGLRDVVLLGKEVEELAGVHTMLLNPGWVQTDLGGANASMSIEDSVTQLIDVIDQKDRIPNGAFWNYNGKPWGSELDENGKEKYPMGKW